MKKSISLVVLVSFVGHIGCASDISSRYHALEDQVRTERTHREQLEADLRSERTRREQAEADARNLAVNGPPAAAPVAAQTPTPVPTQTPAQMGARVDGSTAIPTQPPQNVAPAAVATAPAVPNYPPCDMEGAGILPNDLRLVNETHAFIVAHRPPEFTPQPGVATYRLANNTPYALSIRANGRYVHTFDGRMPTERVLVRGDGTMCREPVFDPIPGPNGRHVIQWTWDSRLATTVEVRCLGIRPSGAVEPISRTNRAWSRTVQPGDHDDDVIVLSDCPTN